MGIVVRRFWTPPQHTGKCASGAIVPLAINVTYEVFNILLTYLHTLRRHYNQIKTSKIKPSPPPSTPLPLTPPRPTEFYIIWNLQKDETTMPQSYTVLRTQDWTSLSLIVTRQESRTTLHTPPENKATAVYPRICGHWTSFYGYNGSAANAHHLCP